tara:strand:- start:27 stop:1034 length:1008 start_codon:yes stop_codon:yes gene_type:complete
MVRSYLIENRICYKGDGAAAAEARESATPAQTDEQDRPLARGTTNLIDDSRQILPPVGASQEDEDVSQMREQAIATVATLQNPDADPVQQQILRDRVGFKPSVLGDIDDPQNDVRDRVRETVAINQIPVGAQDVTGLINRAVAESLSRPNRPDPVTPTMAPGRRSPMSGFFADAYDDLYGTPDPNDAPVTAPGTAINAIIGGGLLGNLFNAPDPADAAAFAFGQRQRMQQDPSFVPTTTSVPMDMGGNDEPANVVAQPPATDPIDPGTTPPEVIDDLAVNYLRDPFFLYSGQGNLFQPYGYAGGTLVDLLQTRGMTPPQQAAANLNLFGNPRDFV